MSRPDFVGRFNWTRTFDSLLNYYEIIKALID